MCQNLAPVVSLSTNTFLRYRWQFLLLPQFVSQCIEGSLLPPGVLRLIVDDLSCPAPRILFITVVGVWVELSENIIDFAAGSLNWI